MAKKNKLNTPEGRTEFAKDSEKAQAAAGENSMAVALFGQAGAAVPAGLEKLMAKAERRNLPQMLKLGDIPIGSIVTGEIIRVVPSPVTTVKGCLLWLRHESGSEFLLPCSGVIRNALIPGTGADSKEQIAALEQEIGKTLIAKRLADKMSDKYKKVMYMFDVFTVTH